MVEACFVVLKKFFFKQYHSFLKANPAFAQLFAIWRLHVTTVVFFFSLFRLIFYVTFSSHVEFFFIFLVLTLGVYGVYFFNVTQQVLDVFLIFFSTAVGSWKFDFDIKRSDLTFVFYESGETVSLFYSAVVRFYLIAVFFAYFCLLEMAFFSFLYSICLFILFYNGFFSFGYLIMAVFSFLKLLLRMSWPKLSARQIVLLVTFPSVPQLPQKRYMLHYSSGGVVFLAHFLLRRNFKNRLVRLAKGKQIAPEVLARLKSRRSFLDWVYTVAAYEQRFIGYDFSRGKLKFSIVDRLQFFSFIWFFCFLLLVLWFCFYLCFKIWRNW